MLPNLWVIPPVCVSVQSCRLRAGRSWSCFGADLACLCPVHVSGWGGLTCSQPALVSATSSWLYRHHTKLHHNFIFLGGGDLKEKKKTFSKRAKTFITTCNSNTFRCCISLCFSSDMFLWWLCYFMICFGCDSLVPLTSLIWSLWDGRSLISRWWLFEGQEM